LDGLRGIAVATVLFYHYVYLSVNASHHSTLSQAIAAWRIGWCGVDLFFVLSGFLIGGILIDVRGASNYYEAFYTRRFLRIVPIYMGLLGAYMLFSVLTRDPTATRFRFLADNHLPLLPYVFFVQNFWMAAQNGFGGTTLGITWSLAIEEQFYLTLPLLIRYAPQKWLSAILVIGIASAELARLACIYWLKSYASTYAFAMMPCRADALLLGVLAAYALRDPNWKGWLIRNRRPLLLVTAVLGVGVLILDELLPRFGYLVMIAGGYSWIAAFFTSCLVYAVLMPDSFLSRILRLRWLRFLGLISYGTYLFHYFILNLVFGNFRGRPPQLESPLDLVLTLGALTVTIIFCWLSWVKFEKPLLNIGHRRGYLNTEPVIEAPLVLTVGRTVE
jgi:peptidoglycan/LPS O-acetylase OafA/YrhL